MTPDPVPTQYICPGCNEAAPEPGYTTIGAYLKHCIARHTPFFHKADAIPCKTCLLVFVAKVGLSCASCQRTLSLMKARRKGQASRTDAGVAQPPTKGGGQ